MFAKECFYYIIVLFVETPRKFITAKLSIRKPGHRVDKTYRDVTDRCKHFGRLRYHVPTFFQKK